MTKKWDKKVTRPPWCFDKDCKVIYSVFDEELHDAGCSSFCYGRLPKAHVFTHRTAEHVNTICNCEYTPLKGAIRFFVNEEDIWGEIQALIAVLNRTVVANCQKCKREQYRRIVYVCPKCDEQ